MRKKLTPAVVAVLAASLCLAASAMAVNAFTIYGNNMDTVGKRGQMRGVSGRACDRGGSKIALRVEVGKRTTQCVYRTPAIGRDVEIGVTERILSGTLESIRKRVFLSVSVRSGSGLGRYQLVVFPLQRKYQLRKYVPGEAVQYLAVGKRISAIKGLNKANRVRLRAFNLLGTRDKDDCRLLVSVNDKRLAVVTDRRSGSLQGRETTFSIGSKRIARGAIGSFDDVRVRIPAPF